MNKVINKYLNNRNVWYLVMLICVSIISIAHAALNTTLSISGTATARAKSDIRVTNIKLKSSTNGGGEYYSARYSKNTTTTGVMLAHETSTVTYTVTIHNYSNNTYMLQDIQTVEDSNTNITFRYSNDIIGDDIPKGEDMTFDIIFSNTTSEEEIKTLILKYIFVENNKYFFYEKVIADNTVTSGTPDFSNTNTSTGYMYQGTDNLGVTHYFRGNVTNNYVLFNGFYWRIVGVFDNKVKLVRSTSIGEYSWTSNSGTTINKWDPDLSNNYTGAAIMNLMNPGYESLSINNSLYWNSGSGNCYNGSAAVTTACDFTSTGLKNDTTRNLISTEKYYLYSPWIGELYADELYVQERGTSPGSQYDGSGDSPPMPRNGYWEGKIGLLYPSDHAYGATPGSCQLPVYNWASPCIRSDWLAYETEERFLTPSFKQSNAWFARKIGTLEGHVASGDAAEAKNIRPVLYLYANQEFKAGDGTPSNPIQLKVN